MKSGIGSVLIGFSRKAAQFEVTSRLRLEWNQRIAISGAWTPVALSPSLFEVNWKKELNHDSKAQWSFCFTIHNIHKCLDTLLYASRSQSAEHRPSSSSITWNLVRDACFALYPPRPRESKSLGMRAVLFHEPFSGFWILLVWELVLLRTS